MAEITATLEAHDLTKDYAGTTVTGAASRTGPPGEVFGTIGPARFALIAGLASVAPLSLGVLASLFPASQATGAASAIAFFPMMFFAGLWLANRGPAAPQQPRPPFPPFR